MNATKVRALVEQPLKILRKNLEEGSTPHLRSGEMEPEWIISNVDDVVNAAAELLDHMEKQRKRNPRMYFKMLALYRVMTYLHSRSV